MNHSNPIRDKLDSELCGMEVYWWDGEYDGNCQLPKGHLEPFHYDGISYFDDDMNNRDNEQKNLEALIQAQVREARIDELTDSFREFSKDVPFAERLEYYDNRLNALNSGDTKDEGEKQ